MLKKTLMLSCAFALLVATGAAAQTDAALTASVKSRLAADSAVKAAQIDVSTEGHVVTLEGTVPSQAAKDRALMLARQTTGVTSVVDRLTVGVPGKTTADKAADAVARGADKSADAIDTAAHKTAKGTGKAVDNTGDALETAASKTGEAVGTAARKTGSAVGTAAEKTGETLGVGADKSKEATAKAARKTAEATGTAGRATSDAAITSAVKSRLLGDGKTPGLDIDVDTDDGVVTLSGDLQTASQKATALRLARETKGVVRVVDKLTVAGK
jgi:osmotically-inducible protein OsmY